MTLVVARKISDSFIHVVSDTRITDLASTTRRDYLKGALKSVVLTPKKCLCYAGSVPFALEAIKGIQKSDLASRNSQSLVNYLLEIHRESNQETDFILCDLEAGGAIHSIKDGQHNVSSAAWVGDAQAFSYFQESLNSGPEHKPGDSLTLRMLSSMLRLVHTSAFSGIGSVGDHVRVRSRTFFEHIVPFDP